MRSIRLFMFAALAVITLAAPSLLAQESQITIAADSSSGTYAKMIGDVVDVCSSEGFTVNSVVGNPAGSNGGAVGNLQALFENKVQAAFLHSDVYQYNAQSDPNYNRIKTLVSLYPEPIHVLALKQSKMTRTEEVKSLGGFRTTTRQVSVDFNSLSDINGYKVGAAGGGWVTVRVLKGAPNAKFMPTEYPTGGAAIKALDSGEVAAVIFVGAAPLPNLVSLDKSKYKLLPIGEAIAGSLGNVYRSTRINYPGLTNGPVQTLAPLALVMTRQYNTPGRVAAQRRFRECVARQLPVLQDNHSPNWQDVMANDRGIAVIPWLELSTPARPATK